MKNIIKTVAVATAFVFTSLVSYACDINFEILNGKKAEYSKNDEVTAKVILTQTHRGCGEGTSNIQLTPKGMEIAQATKWVEKSAGVFERKLKLKITGDKGKATLDVVKTCSKDGGKGTLTLKIK